MISHSSMPTPVNRNRPPADPGIGAYIFRLAAMTFALILLTFVPALWLFMTLAPAQMDLFELLDGPVGRFIIALAMLLGFFLLWGIAFLIKNAKS